MNEILLSFWTIIVLVAVGYILAKTGVTRPGADRALSRLTFNALIPALMFSTITRADPADVFSLTAAGIIATATILAVGYVLLGRYVLSMSGGDIAIGSLVASYVNAGNIGLAYMQAITGDITIIAPIMIFQLCVMVPIYFAVLDRVTGAGSGAVLASLTAPLTAPPVIAVFAGLTVSVLSIDLPDLVTRPISTLGGAAVPIMLLTLGISFYGQQLPPLSRSSAPLFVAVGLRTIVGPILAYGIGSLIGLSGSALLTITVAGAFPTANNIFVYAAKYETGIKLAREGILLTTIVSLPVTFAIAAVMT